MERYIYKCILVFVLRLQQTYEQRIVTNTYFSTARDNCMHCALLNQFYRRSLFCPGALYFPYEKANSK